MVTVWCNVLYLKYLIGLIQKILVWTIGLMLVEIMFLEVDLDYPDDLHNLHNDYLLEILSEYQLEMIEENIFFLVKMKNLHYKT